MNSFEDFQLCIKNDKRNFYFIFIRVWRYFLQKICLWFMKLIIIEGTDNTGKDTIISKLLEKYPTVTLIHCSAPYSKKYSSKK